MPNKPISDKEQLAWDFAKEKHAGQKRAFSGLSYFDAHVQKVNGTLKQYTTDEDLLCAALLHDTIEDCFEDKWEGYKVIKEIFGKRVANIVLELTSDKDEIIHKYDGSKTHYLIHKMLNMSDDAFLIKLCDRLQNISDAFTANEKFRLKYYLETKEIIDIVKERRTLDKNQMLLIEDIESKLENVKSIFKLEEKKHIKGFSESLIPKHSLDQFRKLNSKNTGKSKIGNLVYDDNLLNKKIETFEEWYGTQNTTGKRYNEWNSAHPNMKVVKTFNESKDNDIKPIIGWINIFFNKKKIKEIKEYVLTGYNNSDIQYDIVDGNHSSSSIQDNGDIVPQVYEKFVYKRILEIIYDHFGGLTQEQKDGIQEYVVTMRGVSI